MAVALAVSACAGIEFGARPASTIRPLAEAGDLHFIEANGVRFAYLEEGEGPLILLLHGYPETARSWAGVQHRLAAAGFRVVAPSMRGYPPSSAPGDANYSVASTGRDVLSLIEALGAEQAIVVGHDWGGSAAYAAATMRPDKVRKLVAIAVPHPRALVGDPTLFCEAQHFAYYQLPWAERLLWSHDFAHIDRIYKAWAPNYQPPREVMDDIKSTLRSPGAVEGALSYYRALLKNLGGDASAARLPVTVASLVIAGTADGAFGLARFEKARAAFSGTYEFVTLHAGHFPQLEAPNETADAILAFVNEGQ
jgi:pimeloyl-ACP methyl ester carboxylesterase